MNYPTSNHHVKPNLNYSNEEDGYLLDRYDPQAELIRPWIGSINETDSRGGLIMVEGPLSERNVSRAFSPMNQKDLIDLIQELRHHNEELTQTNRILTDKLDQTVTMMNEGFRSIQSALTNIPGQISQSFGNAISQSLPTTSDHKVWVTDSEASSVISGIDDIIVFDSLSINTDEDGQAYERTMEVESCTREGRQNEKNFKNYPHKLKNYMAKSQTESSINNHGAHESHSFTTNRFETSSLKLEDMIVPRNTATSASSEMEVTNSIQKLPVNVSERFGFEFNLDEADPDLWLRRD